MKKKVKPELDSGGSKKGTIKITIPVSPPHKFLNHVFAKNSVPRVSTPVAPGIVTINANRQGEKLLLGTASIQRVYTPQCQLHTIPTRSTIQGKTPSSSLIKINLNKQIRTTEEETNAENISKIIFDDKCHVVSLFKEYLIFDDIKELLTNWYKITESRKLLKELIPKRQKPLIPFKKHWPAYKIFSKAEDKKAKIYKLKNEKSEKDEDGSTFLRTAYMNSLAKEDLSNSLSRLPANSLECSNEEDCGKILVLLSALNDKDVSAVRKSRLEIKEAQKPNLTQTKKQPLIISPKKSLQQASSNSSYNKIPTTSKTAKLLTQLKGLTINSQPKINTASPTLGSAKQHKALAVTKEVSNFSRTAYSMGQTLGALKSPTNYDIKKATPGPTNVPSNFVRPFQKYAMLTTKKLAGPPQGKLLNTGKITEHSKGLKKANETSSSKKASTSIGIYLNTGNETLPTNPFKQFHTKIGPQTTTNAKPSFQAKKPLETSGDLIKKKPVKIMKPGKIDPIKAKQNAATVSGIHIPNHGPGIGKIMVSTHVNSTQNNNKPIINSTRYKPPIKHVDLTNKLNI